MNYKWNLDDATDIVRLSITVEGNPAPLYVHISNEEVFVHLRSKWVRLRELDRDSIYLPPKHRALVIRCVMDWQGKHEQEMLKELNEHL